VEASAAVNTLPATAVVPGAGVAVAAGTEWPPVLTGHAIHRQRIGGIITLPSSFSFLVLNLVCCFFLFLNYIPEKVTCILCVSYPAFTAILWMSESMDAEFSNVVVVYKKIYKCRSAF
jgi:hypothetical protein